jgi:hypothetical protein
MENIELVGHIFYRADRVRHGEKIEDILYIVTNEDEDSVTILPWSSRERELSFDSVRQFYKKNMLKDREITWVTGPLARET